MINKTFSIENIKSGYRTGSISLFGIALQITDVFWITLNSGIKLFFGLIGSILFARLAGVEYFGRYQYIFSLNGIAFLILLPGIENALINSTVKKTEGDFRIAFRKKLKLLPFFITFFLAASIVMWLIKKDVDIALAFLIIGVFSGVTGLFDYHRSYFVGRREYRQLFIFGTIISLSSIFVAAGYFLLSKFTSQVPLSVLITIPLIWNLLGYFLLFTYVKKRLQYTTDVSQDFFPYAKNLSYMSALGSIQGHLDKFIIGTFLSFESLAFYSIGKRFFEVLKNSWGISQQYLQPRLIKPHISDAFNYFKKYLNMYWLVIPGLIFCWVILPPVIRLLYGQQFIEAASYARLFLFVILFSIPNFYLESFFRAKQFYKDLYAGRMINLLALITLVIFIYYFKAYGIVINQALAGLSISLAMSYLFMRRHYANDLVEKN